MKDFLLTTTEILSNYCPTPSGNNSAVECNLAKVEVAGSNPVSRSKENSRVVQPPFFFDHRPIDFATFDDYQHYDDFQALHAKSWLCRLVISG
jgi:hypothetical protein